MSDQKNITFLENVQNAIANQTFSYRLKEKNSYTNPKKFIIPALLTVSGNPKEIKSYFASDPENISDFKKVLKGTLYHTAHEIYQQHPEVSSYAMNHPALKKKLDAGPFARLSYTDKVSRALGLLLVDFKNYVWLKKSGYLNWDDGSYEACMMISYGWRRMLPDKLKLTQSAINTHFEMRPYLKKLTLEYPDQPLIQFVSERYEMAWYQKNSQQISRSVDYFNSLRKLAPETELSKSLQLLGTSSLADLALRYQKTDLLITAINNLEQELPQKKIKERSTLIYAKIQVKLLQGDTIAAKLLIDKLSRYGTAALKKESAYIYEKIGETKKAERVRKKLKLE